jgi:hypothetical protein
MTEPMGQTLSAPPSRQSASKGSRFVRSSTLTAELAGAHSAGHWGSRPHSF